MFSLCVTRGWFDHMSFSPCDFVQPGMRFATGHSCILAVIVLHNRPFKDVPCAARLRQWLIAPAATAPGLTLARCLIYDNSPVAQPLDFDLSPERIDVFHDVSNGGTRAAYLHALKIARMHGYPWILFLDHDTDVPDDLFTAAERALSSLASDTPVCAVVPCVLDGTTQISPSRITTYGRIYPQPNERAAVDNSIAMTAIASASLVRTDALNELLPIPMAFSLDYLDHWIFRELQRRGGCIAISSARVVHSLSVLSMQSMVVDRYRAILAAELVFLRSGPRYSPVLHLLRHSFRTLKLMLLTRRPVIVGVCVRAALNILRTK